MMKPNDGEGMRNPVFIVGCGRSGTTMLMLMLDRHPDLAIPSESHFIRHLWRQRESFNVDGSFDSDGLTRRILQSEHFRRWEVSDEAVWRRVEAMNEPGFADVIRGVFSAYADSRGKPRWGDKTPIYVRELDWLARLFPDARFLHIIRDGRDVALSYISLPWGPKNAWQAGLKWRRDVEAGCRSGATLGEPHYMEIRYESLVDDANDQLKRVCRFLDLSYEPSMLTPDDKALRKLRHNKEAHTRSVMAPMKGLRDWRRQMHDSDVRAFEAVAGDVLTALAYERRFPHIPLSTRIHTRIRIRAYRLYEIGSRIRRVASRKLTGALAGRRTRHGDPGRPSMYDPGVKQRQQDQL
jgi:Sulfotransferase family